MRAPALRPPRTTDREHRGCGPPRRGGSTIARPVRPRHERARHRQSDRATRRNRWSLRIAARSSAISPRPVNPASAIAAIRSAIGTGLVGGTRMGEVLPALVHAVATSSGSVMSILRRERPRLYGKYRRVACKHGRSRDSGYLFCGKPSSMPPWLGSSQRLVMALPRVKNCTPSAPWACVSPNSEDFQPPKL